MISSRHIRHDWQTFVDWQQKSVKTVCGVTTRRNLAGIPGVTDQPEVVEVKGVKKWGWCTACIRSSKYDLDQVEKDMLAGEITVDETVRKMYDRFATAVLPQYLWWKDQELKRRKERAERIQARADAEKRLAK